MSVHCSWRGFWTFPCRVGFSGTSRDLPPSRFQVAARGKIKSTRTTLVKGSTNVPPDIAGFEEIAGVGLVRDRTVLVLGKPHSSKAIFELQFLKRGARSHEIKRRN